MIIIKLIGGLGNQMFQYAFYRKLSILKNIPVKLDIFGYSDTYFLNKDEKREYSLRHFKIQENLATREEIKEFSGLKSLLRKFIKKIKRDIFKIDNFSFNEKEFQVADKTYLSDYWQSEKYFKDIADILRKEFTLKNDLSFFAKNIEKKIVNSNSVSLHIRRGDYAFNQKVKYCFGLLSLDYYQRAIEIIKDKINNPLFFIFSDDIDWVKKNLNLDASLIYVSNSNLRDYEELVLMSKCKHNIIANSSFSWWGAWLNQNYKKIIVAPKIWFKNRNINTKDIVPDNWIKI